MRYCYCENLLVNTGEREREDRKLSLHGTVNMNEADGKFLSNLKDIKETK